MRKIQYQIGPVQIEVRQPEQMPIPEPMKQFVCQADQVQRYYEIECVDELEPVLETLCSGHSVKRIERKGLTVFLIDGRECRLIRPHDGGTAYAVNCEMNENMTKAWVLTSMLPAYAIETYYISLLSLEKQMIKKGGLILHSAYMCRDGKAVLFSAPSGTGKSTQADLWTKYRGTRTINGDKSLLIREEDGWYANGWPISGSSGICYDEKYLVEAIVMLYQAKENEIRRLKGMEIVRRLMPELTINMWNPEFQLRAMDELDRLISEVPVYELGCNISEDAVNCLEQALLEKE